MVSMKIWDFALKIKIIHRVGRRLQNQKCLRPSRLLLNPDMIVSLGNVRSALVNASVRPRIMKD